MVTGKGIGGEGHKTLVHWVYTVLLFSLIVMKYANKSNGKKPVIAMIVM